MAPKDKNCKAAAADSDSSEELQISLTNMLLGQDPVIVRKKQPAARDAQPQQDAPANMPKSEVDFSLPEFSANDSDGDQMPAPCAVDNDSEADSSSKAESSDESASPCLKNRPSHETCMKDVEFSEGVECLKDVECLKGSKPLKETSSTDGNEESIASTSADSHPETSDASASAMSDKSNDGAADNQTDGDETNASKKSEVTTESNSAVDAESSATSSSGVESCNELESSDKNDNHSTDASTLGEESSKGVSSDEGELKRAPTKEAGGKVAAGGSGWTVSEDHLLRGMKESEDNLSWADIGKALNRNKNDAKGRWKVIKDQPQQFEPDQQASGDEERSTGKDAESTAEASMGTKDLGESSKKTETSAKPSKGAKVLAKSAKEAKAPAKPSREGKEPTTSSKDPKGKGKAKADTPTKWHKGQRNGKVAMENKAARSKAAETNERDRDILSGEEASSESSFVFDDEEDEDDEDGYYYGWPQQKRHDIQYLQSNVYQAMYPNMIQPEPDEFFGERDCAVLASVDSKYKRSKWLEMQANFYNVTGRMVPLHIIRDKCEHAVQEGALRRQEARVKRASLDDSSRRENVAKWVDGVPEEDLEDPEL
ncbi:hypothetical protein TOPH_01847 [Tolypocladium ophioglossoides CBS 100239]|uniref:Myb-like domain-containing protein n=1 Tax=Tolypocladium ophioglossoides (strain CBS 100239) TaxID=1163406 RepID=A0A0L0NIP3_TOLOC|nr:hypothetical protein TOPH_01847 [Tolypocladium ophioglossoides CBS 100239]